MTEDVKVCLAMYILGYTFVSKDVDGSITFHESMPRFDSGADGFWSDMRMMHLSQVYCIRSTVPDFHIIAGTYSLLSAYIANYK